MIATDLGDRTRLISHVGAEAGLVMAVVMVVNLRNSMNEPSNGVCERRPWPAKAPRSQRFNGDRAATPKFRLGKRRVAAHDRHRPARASQNFADDFTLKAG